MSVAATLSVRCPHCQHAFDDCSTWEEDESPGETCPACGGLFAYVRQVIYDVRPVTEAQMVQREREMEEERLEAERQAERAAELERVKAKIQADFAEHGLPRIAETIKDGYRLKLVLDRPEDQHCPGGADHPHEGMHLGIARDAATKIAYYAITPVCMACKDDPAIIEAFEHRLVIVGQGAPTS